MSRATAKPLVIGVTEYVDLPAWGVHELRAKIDTGALNCALHVENVHEHAGYVCFEVRLHRSRSERRVAVEAEIARRGLVRSSNGGVEKRLFVRASIQIGPLVREVELGLVDRRAMIHRMLIGRRALERGFLVDPGRRFVLAGPRPKRRAPRSKASAAQ